MSALLSRLKTARPKTRPQVIRSIRRGVQILALLVFLYLFAAATFMTPLPGLADLFYRLDPLVALTAMLAGRAFIAGLTLAGLTLLLTLVFGRAWCGWLCPMGTTLDLITPGRKARRERESRKSLSRPPGELLSPGWRWPG